MAVIHPVEANSATVYNISILFLAGLLFRWTKETWTMAGAGASDGHMGRKQ